MLPDRRIIRRSSRKDIWLYWTRKAEGKMVELFSKYRRSFIARGVVAFLCGLIILLWGGSSLDLLVVSFGIFALLEGILSVAPGMSKLGGRVYFLLIDGIVGILAGVFTFLGPGIGRMFWPQVATKTLVVLIVLWALLTGVAELIGSFRLPGEMKEKWVVTVSGLVCLLLGLIVLFRSGAGATGNAIAIGLLGIIYGLLWLFIGFKARKLTSKE
jgi:uncharacterized membrane protein HdeD (DUF308 family)